jgi:hypothetical protein
MQTAAVLTLSSTLITIYPIALIDAPTSSMSTSEEYSFNSNKIYSQLFLSATLTRISTFSSFTKTGSLNLQ